MTQGWPARPPASDEFEVTVFGPGVGESVVVHLGQGRWMIVDSCVVDGEPVPLAYLRALGVGPDLVSHAVITHWHDDHHRGATRIVEACRSATVSASAALRGREFLEVVACARGGVSATGLEEFAGVFRRLQADRRPLKWLVQGTRFHHAAGVEAWAVSPAPDAITRTLVQLAALYPREGEPIRRVAPTANECSLALLLKFGERAILLGSDLEEARGQGWAAVVANHDNVGGRAAIYKVAHHGSATAHYDGLFEQLLEPRAVGVVTPFRCSALPSSSDLAWLGARLGELHVTAPPSGRRLPARSPTVERILRQSVRDRRAETIEAGAVRLRFRERGAVSVEHHGEAFRVREVA